jgi:hypothetical protein
MSVGITSYMRSESEGRTRHLGRLVVCAPLLAQLALGPAAEAQDSTARASRGPRPNPVGGTPNAIVTGQTNSLFTPGQPPRDMPCVVRDLSVGLLFDGIMAVFISSLTLPFDKKRAQRKAFYLGLVGGVMYALLRLRKPCDLTDEPASRSWLDPRR